MTIEPAQNAGHLVQLAQVELYQIALAVRLLIFFLIKHVLELAPLDSWGINLIKSAKDVNLLAKIAI